MNLLCKIFGHKKRYTYNCTPLNKNSKLEITLGTKLRDGTFFIKENGINILIDYHNMDLIDCRCERCGEKFYEQLKLIVNKTPKKKNIKKQVKFKQNIINRK